MIAFPLSHYRNHMRICNRTVNNAIKFALRRLTAPVDRFKAQIKACGSLDEFQSFPFPLELSLAYGQAMTHLILASFITGCKAFRKVRQANSNVIPAQAGIQSYSRRNGIPFADDIPVAFSWNLPNTAAVNAFAAQSFTVAQVQAGDLLNALQLEAAKVISQGGTFRDWQDTFKLHGFEPDNMFQLRTNFDTAANAAYLSAQWKQIEELKEMFPYLRYVTDEGDKVCDICGPLNGRIYPTDDPFWSTFYPQNHWNCHCDVEQLTAEEVDGSPDPDKLNMPMPDYEPPVGFNNNVGQVDSINGFSELVKKVNPKDWKELSLPEWDTYAQAKAKIHDFKTAETVLAEYATFLGNRNVIDVNAQPVYLDSSKAYKLDVKKQSDLIGHLKYMDNIDDVLVNPYEKWFNPTNERSYYLKKFDHNVILIAEFNDKGIFEYFNIMLSNDTYLSELRTGVNCYHIKK